MTNIFVFLDTMWSYNHVVDYINYVIQRLNIKPHASSITLLAASDGSVMVNTTHYLSDLYTNWNITTHSCQTPGFSLPIILSTVRDLVENVMITDRNTTSIGGQSLVALLVPSPTAYVSESDYWYSIRYVDYLNRTIPDLQFLYYSGGAVIRFKDFVSKSSEDLLPLSLDSSVRDVAFPVVQRIRRVPRRIVNPRCGASWYTTTWGPNEVVQFARLGSINFYRMVPHYFYHSASMRYLKVQLISTISFMVCTSRTIVLPYRVGSYDPAGQSCSQITTQSFSYDLTDACEGYDSLTECPPLYLSVQAQGFADATQVLCEEAACESPDQAQYLLFVNNLSCCNGVQGLWASFGLIGGSYLWLRLLI